MRLSAFPKPLARLGMAACRMDATSPFAAQSKNRCPAAAIGFRVASSISLEVWQLCPLARKDVAKRVMRIGMESRREARFTEFLLSFHGVERLTAIAVLRL